MAHPAMKKKKMFGQASAWHGIPQCPSPCAPRHPVRGLLCPLSLLLRFTLSLADLKPVQWFAGPLSGPPLPGYSYPSICVSRSPECTSLLRPGVLHWWVVLGQALYLLACLRSILALSSSRFCCSCRASWAPGLCVALVLSTARCGCQKI